MSFNNANWRDCDAWRKDGLKFNTTSNEVCKLYDAALSQYIGWYENKQFNGLGGTIKSILETDPNFIMGHVLDIGTFLLNVPTLQNEYREKLDSLNNLKTKFGSNLNEFELMHIDALNKYAQGDLPKACDIWESILIEHPTDILAIKFAHDAYFYMGYQRQMRDSIARVLPLWKPSIPYYSYLYGMLSFGYVQTNFFSEAEHAALKALELNKHDAWATHTICHLNEYKNTYENGIKFLRDTESDWSICGYLACHNYWHLCLYHLEKDEHEVALSIFDKEVLPRAKSSDAYLDIVDACSLLYRLKLDNCTLLSQPYINDKRWSQVRQICLPHVNDNGFSFNDAHIFMTLSACNDNDGKDAFLNSLNNYLASENTQTYLKNVKNNVSKHLYKAIELYDQNEFDKVVEILYPIRYDILKIGGSNAQRDLFHQILTHSALKSNSKHHNKIGIMLINERKALKPNSKLTERIAARFASIHEFS